MAALAARASAAAIAIRRTGGIRPIVAHGDETFLKRAGVAALLAALLPAAAAADVLVVGAIRDQDGRAVAGARVRALDAAGRATAADRSAPDGTFALGAPAAPAQVAVEADDAEPAHVGVRGDEPLVVTLRRHRSADAVPTAADVAALPDRSAAGLAALIPYDIAFPGATSDRYLARGRGAITVDGIPFYRLADGADALAVVPGGTAGALGVVAPADAPRYGDRAGGGAIDLRPFERDESGRLGTREISFASMAPLAFAGAASHDDDGDRALLATRATGTLGATRGTFGALAARGPLAALLGASASLAAQAPRTDLSARLDLARDLATAGDDRGDVARLVLGARGRSAVAPEVDLRAQLETSSLGGFGTRRAEVAIAGAATGHAGAVVVHVALAGERVDDTAYDARATSLALVPSLRADAPLGDALRLRAAVFSSILGAPGTGTARATTEEAALAYRDRRRLRAEVVAFSERLPAARTHTAGFGASLGYELAPRLALRAWTLDDVDAVIAAGVPVYGPIPPLVRRFRRDVVWLTWDVPARVDLLLAGGALGGTTTLPLGAHTALVVASWRRLDRVRAASASLVVR